MDDSKVTCSECNKMFQFEESLVVHHSVCLEHQDNKSRRPFSCDQCGKSFKTMTSLRNHARTHTSYFDITKELYDQTLMSTFSSDSTVNTSILESTRILGADSSVIDRSKNISVDRTYIIENKERDAPIETKKDISGLPIDTSRAVTGHVTKSSRRRSGIPVPIFSKKPDNLKLAKDKTIVNTSPLRGITSGASVKSIRTLRNYRSKPGTPVNTKKSRNTPDRKSRSKSRSRVQNRNQSSLKSVTPNQERCSKYADRIAAHSAIDSPFRLTLMSPRFTPHGKRKNTPGGATYKCKKCGKLFNDKDQFDIHYVIHARDTPAKCGIPADCYKKNNRKLLFSTPDKKVNIVQKSTPSFACPHCQRCYQSERYLRSHIKIHYKDVPFPCSHCDKQFKFVQSLRAHAITHIGEESHKTGSNIWKGLKMMECNKKAGADNCDKTQESLTDTNTHLDHFEDDAAVKEMLETPFTCMSCPFKTNQPTDLLKHMRIHSRAKPYKCNECDKSYKTKSNLELHGKVHMIGKIRTILSNRINSVDQRT